MKKILFLFISILVVSCTNSQEIQSVSAEELTTILKAEKVQLLDVRTPGEVEQGAIENAVFVNIYDDNFLEKSAEKLNKEQPVYIYCKSGGRSMKASEMLQEKGYKVINVKGGFTAWKNLKK